MASAEKDLTNVNENNENTLKSKMNEPKQKFPQSNNDSKYQNTSQTSKVKDSYSHQNKIKNLKTEHYKYGFFYRTFDEKLKKYVCNKFFNEVYYESFEKGNENLLKKEISQDNLCSPENSQINESGFLSKYLKYKEDELCIEGESLKTFQAWKHNSESDHFNNLRKDFPYWFDQSVFQLPDEFLNPTDFPKFHSSPKYFNFNLNSFFLDGLTKGYLFLHFNGNVSSRDQFLKNPIFKIFENTPYRGKKSFNMLMEKFNEEEQPGCSHFEPGCPHFKQPECSQEKPGLERKKSGSAYSDDSIPESAPSSDHSNDSYSTKQPSDICKYDELNRFLSGMNYLSLHLRFADFIPRTSKLDPNSSPETNEIYRQFTFDYSNLFEDLLPSESDEKIKYEISAPIELPEKKSKMKSPYAMFKSLLRKEY